MTIKYEVVNGKLCWTVRDQGKLLATFEELQQANDYLINN